MHIHLEYLLRFLDIFFLQYLKYHFPPQICPLLDPSLRQIAIPMVWKVWQFSHCTRVLSSTHPTALREKKAAEEGERAQSVSGTMENASSCSSHSLAIPTSRPLVSVFMSFGTSPTFYSGCHAGEVGKR